MKKAGTDPKVKKTLVRDCEQKIRKERERVTHEVEASSSKTSTNSCNPKDNDLDHPSLCSSEALAKYLLDTKKSSSPHQVEDVNVDKGQITAKVTKMLNFHFNDRIYKNLVELNADTASLKNKKDAKPKRPSTLKKDLEPKIEDFYNNEDEPDICPNIPVITPKFNPIRQVEKGHLHRLVASFECL